MFLCIEQSIMKTKTYNFADETAELKLLLAQVRDSAGGNCDGAPATVFALWTALDYLLLFIHWRQTADAIDALSVEHLIDIDASYQSAKKLLEGIEIIRLRYESDYAASKEAQAQLAVKCAGSLYSVGASWVNFDRRAAARLEAQLALHEAVQQVGTASVQLNYAQIELWRDTAACESWAQSHGRQTPASPPPG